MVSSSTANGGSGRFEWLWTGGSQLYASNRLAHDPQWFRPNSYSRRICSNNSTLALQPNESPPLRALPESEYTFVYRVGQNKMPHWAKYRNHCEVAEKNDGGDTVPEEFGLNLRAACQQAPSPQPKPKPNVLALKVFQSYEPLFKVPNR